MPKKATGRATQEAPGITIDAETGIVMIHMRRRRRGEKNAYSKEVAHNWVVGFDEDDKPIDIEVLTPSKHFPEAVRRLLPAAVYSRPLAPTNRVPEHPGEILLEEFLRPLNMARSALAKKMRTPAGRIAQLIDGKLDVDEAMARGLGKVFKTGSKFWINLQTTYDLARARAVRRG